MTNQNTQYVHTLWDILYANAAACRTYYFCYVYFIVSMYSLAFSSNKWTYTMKTSTHTRGLRVIYNYYTSSFYELLEKTNRSFSCFNMTTIVIEMYKCSH